MPDTTRLRRRRGRDDLGLRRALGDRLLPALVAATTFLAALAVAGIVAAHALAQHWDDGPVASLTAQVSRPDEPSGPGRDTTRLQTAIATLRAAPNVVDVRPLARDEIDNLLRPWFAGAAPPPALELPGVIDLRLAPGTPVVAAAAALRAGLAAAVPGAVLDDTTAWNERLIRLADSLQACAWLTLALVAGVAALIVVEAIRGGLLARRDTIVIAHGLGATDGYVAVRFARRACLLCLGGGLLGAGAALPVWALLAALAAPFASAAPLGADVPWWQALPRPLWLALPMLPAAAAAIGYATTQLTVRAWLRRLP